MDFLWAENKKEFNDELVFTYNVLSPCDSMELCAADFFRVYADGKLISYGPERTEKGYARKRRVTLPHAVKELVVKVLYYGVKNYTCVYQEPYFGAVIYNGKEVVANTDGFTVTRSKSRRISAPKYSNQRGFLEIYDYKNDGVESVAVKSVPAPVLVDGIGDTADYQEESMALIGKSVFNGFDEINKLWWENNVKKVIGEIDYDVVLDMAQKAIGFNAYDFTLSGIKSGFIKLKIKAQKDTKIFAVFEEILPNGKWIFRRSACNDYVEWNVGAGEYTLLSAEPYTFKVLKVLCDSDIEVDCSIIKLENTTPAVVSVDGEERLTKIFKAAENSFRQNAVDLFTDCAGRERAGWLCDSYFAGIAENLFFGNNAVEKNFIDNFLLIDTSGKDKVVLPMCFPSETGSFTIPNWTMWFVLELLEYFNRTGDRKTIEKAKEKVYKIVKHFEGYLNEFGLLEDLDGWVFVEWSICNDADYVKGVNFPSNMLYAKMLETVDMLYGDKELYSKAQKVKTAIKELSFNGEFYVDNATRKNGVLTAEKTHLSETCQYYAIFSGTETSAEFIDNIINAFGPLNPEKAGIGRSNVFIGYYLRFMMLIDNGKHDRVIEESIKLFDGMAQSTQTLWEKDDPSASCNHGFASVIAAFMLRSLIGFRKINGNTVVLDKAKHTEKEYGLKVEFNLKDNPITVYC